MKVKEYYNNMTQILLKFPNILLDDSAITEWTSNYEEFWKSV